MTDGANQEDRVKQGKKIILLMGLAMLLIPLGFVPVANAAAVPLILALVIFTARKTIRYFRDLGENWKGFVTESRVISWLSLITLIFWLNLGWLEFQVYLEWANDADLRVILEKHPGSGWFWLCHIWTALFGTYLSLRAAEIRTVIYAASAGISDLRYRRSFFPWLGALTLAGTMLLLFTLLILAGTALALQAR